MDRATVGAFENTWMTRELLGLGAHDSTSLQYTWVGGRGSEGRDGSLALTFASHQERNHQAVGFGKPA